MMVDRAVVWDFDGTLVDTRRKNWQVTRALIPAVSGRPVEAFPALASLAAYQLADQRSANWRALYGREFGLSDEKVDQAGRLWTEYQLADQTPTPFFDGVAEALAGLGDVPQAIFSQNSRLAIQRALEAAGLADYFQLVVGYEEVGFQQQKPAPDGLLYCLEQLGLGRGEVLFVGDHDTDVICARRANAILAQKHVDLRVLAVGAAFGQDGPTTWAERPDYVARWPDDVVTLVNRER